MKEIGTNPSSPKALGDLLMRWVHITRPPLHSVISRLSRSMTWKARTLRTATDIALALTFGSPSNLMNGFRPSSRAFRLQIHLRHRQLMRPGPWTRCFRSQKEDSSTTKSYTTGYYEAPHLAEVIIGSWSEPWINWTGCCLPLKVEVVSKLALPRLQPQSQGPRTK